MRRHALVVLAGCGFPHGAIGGGSADGGIDTPDGRLADASSDSIGIGPWGTPTMIIPGGNDDDPTATADLLEIYFNRTSDIYVITRTAIGAPWSTPTRVDELSSTSYDTTPEMTSDGLTMFLSSDRTGTVGSTDVFMATRSSRTSAWGTPIRVNSLSDVDENACATPIDDLKTMVISRVLSNNVDVDIYATQRATPTGAWATPGMMPGTNLNTTAGERGPMLSQDTLTLYFDSDRTGNNELYVVTRTPNQMSFDNPTLITELQTDAYEADIWISPDQRHMIYVIDSVLYETSR